MNISFQQFRRLWLLPILLLTAVLPSMAIEINGVQYTEHNSQTINGSTKLTLGADGQNHYYVLTNSSIEMGAGQGAAIEIKGNVAIGVIGTLNVKGGDGLGYKGAGAGIHVPKGSTLTILPASGQSSCTVTANGGNAGEPNVILSNSSIWFKYNNGAGGAGAGIGGNGGDGGNTDGILDANGNFTNCHYGHPSDECGNVIIEKGVTLTAIGGRGTGVAHDNNGQTLYNFDLVSQEHNPINHGYVPGGINSKYPNLQPSSETASYDGDSWSTSNYARGSVGGQGGGGGGYPAAGIGGGGSGGGAGGFGTYASEESGKSKAKGHGGNAGGGGTGYGKAGEYGFGGGYCSFGFGMEKPILITCIEDAYGAGGHREDKSNSLYSGSNGYWGQKNFSGTGHAAGATGSTQLNGVRPGTFLDGGKGGPVVSGSAVTEPGFIGGGVLFDSQCGEITIRGNVTSLGNGGHQPKQFETIGSVTYTEPNKPYYINDIGTALNGEHNPFSVKVDGGTLKTNRQDGLSMTDASGYPAKEYTVTVTQYLGYIGGGLAMRPPEKKTIRVSGIQHYKERFGASALYVSFIGLEAGKERFVYANPRPDMRNGAHTDGISVAERYYSDKNLPSADWSYTTTPSWSTVTNSSQTDYSFNGRVDTSTSEDKLGVFMFNANVHGGTLNFAGQQIGATNGSESKALLLSSNRFQTTFHRTSSDGGCDLSWMSWKPLNFIFSGKGGRNYELQNVSLSTLPSYKNNNIDGSRILGYYTEVASDKDGEQQINGLTYNSIEEFARAGYGDIHVVTWNPNIELVSSESRGKINISGDNWNGAWQATSDGYTKRIMAKLSYNSYNTSTQSMNVTTSFDNPTVIAFTYKGFLKVALNGQELSLTSSEWTTANISLPSGAEQIQISALVGRSEDSFIYDFREFAVLPQDENGCYIIRTSEDLDAASELVNNANGSAFNFRIIGEVETSSDFVPFGQSFGSAFSGTMTGGHIKLTNNQPLVIRADGATFSNMTVSGDLFNDGQMVNDLAMFALYTENVKFINCKIDGSLDMNGHFGYILAGFSANATNTEFIGCVNNAKMIGAAMIRQTSSATIVQKPTMGGFAVGFAFDADDDNVKVTDCAFTGSIYTLDDNGNVYNGNPFVSVAYEDDTSVFPITNSISTFNPQMDEIPNTVFTNSYILADSDGSKGNYTTKTATQFASGEVGYLLAEGGDSHWYTPIGSAYPVYDADKVYTHAHVMAGDNVHLSNHSQSKATHLYTLEGMEFNATHSQGKDCLIYHNDELVATNGSYDGTAPAGESFVAMKEHAVVGDEIDSNGIKYVILTVPNGDTPGTVATKSGTYENYGNSGLSGDIVIPETIYSDGRTYTVTEIGDYSLEGGSVTAITLPESLTTIGESGLRGLTGITTIAFPANVTSLGFELFKNCSNLKNVYFAEDTKITSIPQSAFEETGLTRVVIPESVTEIGQFAYFRCPNLEYVEMHYEISNLGWMAFGECDKLSTFIYLSDDPVTGSAVDFSDQAFANASLYALASAKDKYQSVDPWQKFTNTVWCGLSLDKTEITLRSGDSESLEATVTLPPNTVKSQIEWSSSNPLVASVDENGIVTAHSNGTATITATSGDYSADCEVSVNDISTAIDEIFADGSTQVDVYTLQGICIKRNATADDINNLPSGLYIVGGRKVYLQAR